MASLILLLPFAAEIPATNMPQLIVDAERRPGLRFDGTTQETCFWTTIARQGLTTPLTAVISYYMTSATTGGVVFGVAIEAVTALDALNLATANSFGADNENGDITVPGTAGFYDQIVITLTDNDSIAAGDYVRVRLRRDPADVNDDASAGDCHVLAVEVRDAA